MTPITATLLSAAAYLVILACVMTTKNTLSFALFRVLPAGLGIACIWQAALMVVAAASS